MSSSCFRPARLVNLGKWIPGNRPEVGRVRLLEGSLAQWMREKERKLAQEGPVRTTPPRIRHRPCLKPNSLLLSIYRGPTRHLRVLSYLILTATVCAGYHYARFIDGETEVHGC